MQGMNGHKHHIIILICQFDDFMHPALVILHAHQPPEDSHSIIYMDDIIPYRKGCKVVDRELFALLYSATYADPVESVEYLMVTIATYLVFMVDETVMNVAFHNKLRKYRIVLRKNGLESFQLRLLLSIDPDPVTFF